MFLLSYLQSLVHLRLQLFLKRLHFFLLPHHHICFRCVDNLLHIVGVFSSFTLFHRVRLLLDLVSFAVVLLSSHVFLLFAHVEKVCGSFELLHEGGLEFHSVLLESLRVFFLSGSDFFLICLLGECEFLVPMLIKLLVLADVRLFTLYLLRLVHEYEFFLLASIFLVFEFVDTVVSELGFNVSTLSLHLQTMFIKRLSIIELSERVVITKIEECCLD